MHIQARRTHLLSIVITTDGKTWMALTGSKYVYNTVRSLSIPASTYNSNKNEGTIEQANLTSHPNSSDPNVGDDTVYVDVWWGTDADAMDQIVTAEAISQKDVDSSDIDTYYWRVDTTIGDANAITGNPPSTIETGPCRTSAEE